MSAADHEIKANSESFRHGLGPKFAENITLITSLNATKLDQAYSRLTSLQAWRAFVLETQLSKQALGFFSEAQNDGLTSSALMATGLWRSAMKSLRSLIENLLHCLYFADHPVEYRLWDSGNFRPTFKELFDYFIAHPDIRDLPASLNAAVGLKGHYKHLSNVVHSSAREFRMTDEVDKLKLWDTTTAGVGKWSATHVNVLRDVNLLLATIFFQHIQGATNKGLREALALAIPSSKDTPLKDALGITVVR